jgi:lysophospholipid acyltransferase (LPLAT)-like uncharacterized protein
VRLASRVGGRLGDVAIAAGPRLVLALGATWRVRHAGRERVDAARRRSGGPVLYVFTHGVLLPLSYTHRGRRIHVLVSESRDGEIITRVIERLGFATVRGSSTRGGARAIARLAARAREGFDLGITPDGPKGPRFSAEPGTVFVAARAGVPVVPVGVAATSGWRADSWDRFLVPKPFARVWLAYGAPLFFGRDDVLRIDEATARVARAVADVDAEASAYASGRAAAPSVHRVPA